MIRPLAEADLEAYVALRRRSLIEEPLSFAASPSDDFASSATALREQMRQAPYWMLFGAFDGDTLAGAAGLLSNRRAKSAHKLILWGMYVAPSHRGRGLGRALVAACIAHARSLEGVDKIHLSVTSAASEARRLYERAGFRIWGTDRDALRHEGHAVDEHHMALELRSIR
jgi:RimJ/RimL family protein N-acetyltransferase